MLNRLILIAAASLLLAGAAASAQTGGLDDRLNDLANSDETVRLEAVRALSFEGAEAVPPLVAIIASNADPQAAAARVALEAMVHNMTVPGLDEARVALVNAMMEEIKGDHPVTVRRWLLRLVGFAGGLESTIALCDLIQDPGLGEMAIFALSRIPGEDADLHLQIPMAEPPAGLEAALINALTARGAFPDLGLLIYFTTHPHDEVRLAAIEGLAKIPRMKCAEALLLRARHGSGRESRRAWAAYAELADTFYQHGLVDEAHTLYGRLLEQGGSSQLQCAGLRGMARIDGEEALTLLMKTLNKGPLDLKGAAADALVELKSEKVTEALGTVMAESDSDLQARIIRILAKRGEAEAIPRLIGKLDVEDEAVQVAAIEGLAHLNAAPAAKGLVERVGDGSDSVRDAAKRALKRIEGESVTRAMVEACVGCAPEASIAFYEILAARRDPGGLGTLLAGARSPHHEVRLAAIEALGTLNQQGAVPELVYHLVRGDEKEKDAAQRSLHVLHDPAATEAIKKAARRAPDVARQRIVLALGRRRDGALEPFLVEATRDPSVDVTVAAIEALGLLEDFSVVPRLLEIVREGWPEERAAALEAYVMVGAAMADEGKDDAAFAIYEKVLNQADTAKVKTAALRAMGRLGDETAMQRIAPFLDEDNERVREAAATAIAPLALKRADSLDAPDPKTRAWLAAVVKESDRADHVKSAAGVLRDAGFEVDVPVRKGYVKHFWVVGPLPGRSDLMKSDAVSVMRPVNLSEPVTYKGESYTWKYHPLDHILGKLDLIEEVADQGDCGAYVYAEVEGDRFQRGAFKIGSDDDVYCWLNGELVHRFEGGRGWTADQDTADVILHEGVNRVLLKVLNGSGDWAVSLRITDREGNPLDLEQRIH
jgi:HEAT repeat protein